MPWIRDQGCGYVWFGKGKTRTGGKEGYETISLDERQYQLILYHMRKINLLKGNGRSIMYWQFPNSEEVEINPENKTITFRKDTLRTSVRASLEKVIGIEHVEERH